MELWKIDEQLARLLMLPDGNAVDTETGEVFSTDAIDKLQMDRLEKIEACLLFAKSKRAEGEMVRKEAGNLDERAKQCDKVAERAIQYVQNSLAGANFSTSKVATSYHTSNKCIVECEPEQLPEEFRKTTTEVTTVPLKNELKKYILAGGKVNGVHVDKNVSLIVK